MSWPGSLRAGALALLAPLSLAAQAIAPEEYAARRDSLAARLGDGVVLAFGAPAPTRVERPAQLPAFRWLTGFLEPDAALVLVLRGGRARGILFTQPRDPRRALYDGFPPDSTAVARATGMGVRSIAALAPMLDSLVASKGNDYAESDSLTRGVAFMRAFSARHPGLEVRDVHPVTDSLRARKSPAELALLRRAVEVTVAAQREAMATVRPGVWEYQIEALFDAAFRRTGGDGPAFGSIIGSGPNSTQYHYETNNRQMQAGDLVVMDVGAGWAGYAADVTRTIPVSGRFTPDNNVGVRIEDDYAITPTGVEWLSRAPREPAEIESTMARRGR